MKFIKTTVFLSAVALFAACQPPAGNTVLDSNKNTNSTNANSSNSNSAPTAENLSEVPRPQKIADQMKERGEQDNASPTLSFAEPKDGATVTSSTVKVKLNLAGDLKGYKPMMD